MTLFDSVHVKGGRSAAAPEHNEATGNVEAIIMWCPLCDDYLKRHDWHLVYCPECDNYACDTHWLAAGGKCPVCGMHQIPVTVLSWSAEKKAAFPAVRHCFSTADSSGQCHQGTHFF